MGKCTFRTVDCINHIVALFFSGYKGHSDTGIKQASEEMREIFN